MPTWEPMVRTTAVVAATMPTELSARPPIPVDLALRQAMVGTGEAHVDWLGKPLALDTPNLFERRMRRALGRIDAEGPPEPEMRCGEAIPDGRRSPDSNRMDEA